jgi:hypothetical protein
MPKGPQGHIWPLLVMAALAGAWGASCFYQYFLITPGHMGSSKVLGTAVSVGLLTVWLWRRRAQRS